MIINAKRVTSGWSFNTLLHFLMTSKQLFFKKISPDRLFPPIRCKHSIAPPVFSHHSVKLQEWSYKLANSLSSQSVCPLRGCGSVLQGEQIGDQGHQAGDQRQQGQPGQDGDDAQVPGAPRQLGSSLQVRTLFGLHARNWVSTESAPTETKTLPRLDSIGPDQDIICISYYIYFFHHDFLFFYPGHAFILLFWCLNSWLTCLIF